MQSDHGRLLNRVWRADNVWTRARGLLGRPPLAREEGLWLLPCRTVHTLGMRYTLDLVFLDRDGKICRCVPGLRPGRAAGCRAARSVLELAAGSIGELGLRPGVYLHWRERV